jgi:hypothetical protein
MTDEQQTGGSAWYPSDVQIRGFITHFTYSITNNSQKINQRM